jgi:hypothetical protein
MEFSLKRFQVSCDLVSFRLFSLHRQFLLQFGLLSSQSSDASAELKINPVSTLDTAFRPLGACQTQLESLFREAVAADGRTASQKRSKD